ncbi:MAG: sugar ABC transporter permease [Eggerthellaceae bacterium]|nr:sugar ABC transporter permease [Eggerthellaceae bacterium]
MKDRLAFILSFLPLILLMALGYAVPVFSNIVMSMQNDAGEFVGLQIYQDVFTSYYFVDSLLFTLKVAICSTAISMVIAVVVALALRETFVGKKLVVFMFQFNLTIPRMAAAMMMLLLVSQTGMLSQLSNALGITQGASGFPWLVRDSEGVGLIGTFAWKFFPYIGMSVLGVLQGASREYEDQAAVLGVGKFKRFWHVTLPMIIPATSIASIIVFAAAFGDYEIPAILGSSAHRTLSIYTYMKYSDPSIMNRPESYVLMVTMSIILVIVILLYRHLTMSDKGGRR